MAKSKWMGLEKLMEPGFEKPKKVLKFSSPSINWLYGSWGGIPEGTSAIFWGPPRSGKTIILYDAISQLHKTDPDAHVLYFDTEYKAMAQQGGATSRDIDPDRLMIIPTNDPVKIFDTIEKDVAASIQGGLKLPLIIIDSISMIRGLKSINSDTVEQHLIGDQALTLKAGFQRIQEVLKRNKIALLCTCQARAEMDAMQQRMHKTIKMDASFAVKHFIEFFVQVSQVESKDGKMYNEEMTDSNDNALIRGNRIRCVMNESSFGGKGRTAEVMLSYKEGFVQLGREVTVLGLNLGVINKPEGGNSLVFKENKFRGFEAFASALETNVDLRNEIINEIMIKTKDNE